MSQSIPYRLSQAVVAALRAQFEPLGATVRDNPTSRAALNEGARVVFVEDEQDQPGSASNNAQPNQPNQAEGRSFALAVGVIARTDDARAQADADMEQVKTTLRDAVLAETRAMVAAGQILTVVMPLEGQRLYRLDGIDVGGALVLTRFLLSYRLPSLGRRA